MWAKRDRRKQVALCVDRIDLRSTYFSELERLNLGGPIPRILLDDHIFVVLIRLFIAAHEVAGVSLSDRSRERNAKGEGCVGRHRAWARIGLTREGGRNDDAY